MFERVADGLGKQKDRLKLSLESSAADPLMTIGNFNRQFALGESEKEAVAWAWPDGSSLLTATEEGATGPIVSGGKVPFPYFGAAMQPGHNHTHGQPLPPKSEFLSLLADGSMRTIVSTKVNNGSLLMFLDGAPLDGAVVGYPKKLRFL